MSHSPTLSVLPLSPADEQQLIVGLLEDDARAWRQFSTAYSRVIQRCISRVLNRFGALTSDEDTREVYATLCVQLLSRDKRKLRSYDPERGTRLSTWLGMLATHAAYDFLRSRRRDPKTEETDQEPPSTGAPSPFDICAVREQAAHVSALLEEFSDKDRQFVELYYEQGLEPEQIADEMGISVKTVYSKKHKIRCRLIRMMQSHEPMAA
jgi:RNA polymerase sigma-70 factor (ECF subfamily)